MPLCDQVPAIHLMGNVVWFPNQFLMDKLPNMIKTLDKKAQNAVTGAKEAWLSNKNQMLTR